MGPRADIAWPAGEHSTGFPATVAMVKVVLGFVHGAAKRPPYSSCGGGVYPEFGCSANVIAPETDVALLHDNVFAPEDPTLG